MQKVLSFVTKDSSHCTRGPSWHRAAFEVAAAPFSSSPPSLSPPGMARSMTYFFMVVLRMVDADPNGAWRGRGTGSDADNERGRLCRRLFDRDARYSSRDRRAARQAMGQRGHDVIEGRHRTSRLAGNGEVKRVAGAKAGFMAIGKGRCSLEMARYDRHRQEVFRDRPVPTRQDRRAHGRGDDTRAHLGREGARYFGDDPRADMKRRLILPRKARLGALAMRLARQQGDDDRGVEIVHQ